MGKGRPTKLTQKVQEAMCEGIRKGNYASVVMKGLNIDSGNHWNWYRKGKANELDGDGGNRYVDYFNSINEAEADAEQRMVDQWQEHFPGDWRAIQTFMERRWNDKWGRNDKVKQEVTGKDGGAIETNQKHQTDLTKLSEGELIQLESILGTSSKSGSNSSGES